MSENLDKTVVEKILDREKWLLENQEALKQVKQGLQESAKNQVRSLGSFKKYKRVRIGI